MGSYESANKCTKMCNGNMLSIQRRFSPRLHPTTPHASTSSSYNQLQPRLTPQTDTDVDASTSSSDNQLQRRLSPRLRPTCNSQVQQQLSPCLHQSPRQQDVSNITPTPKLNGHVQMREETKTTSLDASTSHNQLQRPLSPRLHHSSQQLQDVSNETLSPKVEKRCDTVTIGVTTPKRSPAYVFCSRTTKTSTYIAPTIHLGQSSSLVLRSSVYAKVNKTLRLYNLYYLKFLQEEEERHKRSGVKKTHNSAQKKRTMCGPELEAVEKMKEKKEILYPHKQIGHIPGIDVGFKFYSQYEMAAIGFHSDWFKGIDIIGEADGKEGEYKDYTLPIVIAIVMPGQYDKDNSEEIIYFGHGGINVLGSKFQHEDQFLDGNNLAMENSKLQSIPIRVIFGHKDKDHDNEKTYTYGGLYQVVATLCEIRQRGHLVYQFWLQPVAGQQLMSSEKVHLVRADSPKTWSADLPGLICTDISNGQENFCIPVTNSCDGATIGSEGFTYLKTIRVAESVKLPPSKVGCACKGNCTNPRTCSCAKLNGSGFPYVHHPDGGRLCKPKDVVFECGPNCACGPACVNRASQEGIKYRLEVYRTRNKGWAVRSWDPIFSGAPVCEYLGLLRRSDEVDHIYGNDYIFDIDCLHTMNGIEGRERRYGSVPGILPKFDKKALDDSAEFCIDAGSSGNVARFINHSCEPNLFVQCVLSSHHDPQLARVVLFAANDIRPMQELTYDYGYVVDSVVGPDGKVKKLACFCGTSDCRKRLY